MERKEFKVIATKNNWILVTSEKYSEEFITPQGLVIFVIYNSQDKIDEIFNKIRSVQNNYNV